MYLLDTNILLELLLDQDRADEVEPFIREQAPLYVSDFSFHSLGVILLRGGHPDIFLRVSQDLFVRGGVGLLSLDFEDMEAVVQAAQRFRLDFDDAYQYVAAARYDLTIISFDGDFDRTDRGRRTPAEVQQAGDDTR